MYGESRPLADELFDADDHGAPEDRDRVRAAEGPWDNDNGSDRDSDSDSDIWGTVDSDSDSDSDSDLRDRDDRSDADDSDTEDSDTDDSDIEDSESRGPGEFQSPADREASRSGPPGESGADRDKRRGRRRRRRRGGRDRATEPTSSEDIEDGVPAGRLDEPASLESDRRGELDGLDDADDDVDGEHHSHRGIPSWDDAIGFIIDANMEGRARSPKSGGPRGRRGGRGRSSAPRRGRDGERP